MTPDAPVETHAARAKIKAGRSFSIVWIVPIVALLIGAWLGVKALREKGPTIEITFVNAEGLEAGKTKIKHKDVVVGTVDTIRLSDDLQHVIVTADMSKDMTRFLTDKTQFWVMRALIRGGTVSGLGTVLSGAYIGVDPATGGRPARKFTGLEVPPVVTAGQPGRHFWLRAKRLGSVNVGSPVYYRQVQVGQVVSHGFSPDEQSIDIQIFIDAPHHTRVTENTRFFNASGVDVTLGAQGLNIQTESLVALIGGGLAFDLPKGSTPGPEAAENAVFDLYPNHASIQEKTYSVRRYWVLYFDQSVKGLSLGAPVELYGTKIGEVVDLELQFIPDKKDFRVRVLVAIEPERIKGISAEEVQQAAAQGTEPVLKWLVEEKNLRAQLRTGSLLTGQLTVDLGFHPDAPRMALSRDNGYPVVPTVSGSLEQIQDSLARITSRLEKVPLEKIGGDLRKTLQEINVLLRQTGGLVASINNETTPQLKSTLAELQKTLEGIRNTAGKDSPLNYNANRAFEELSLTLESLRSLSDSLNRNPQALIFGRTGEDARDAK